jgi:hypothetical protein
MNLREEPGGHGTLSVGFSKCVWGSGFDRTRPMTFVPIRRAWPAIDGQRKEVRSGVVSNDIQIELASDGLGQIEIGGEDRLIVEVRAREDVALGPNNDASSTCHDRSGFDLNRTVIDRIV